MSININLDSSFGSKEPAREAENILDLADTESLNDLPRKHREIELDLLIGRLDEDRIGHVKPTVDRIKALVNRLEINKQLPYTFGIFGSWGSGKTFVLASLAKTLREEDHKVVYFNAFTYASHTDLTTSLVYRILRAAKPDGGVMKILHQVNAISRTHAKGIYSRGVLPSKLFRAGRELVSNVDSDRQLKVAGEYFGKVDKIHRALAKSLKNYDGKPIHVLIDELDRCDPEEAFNVIKQLRVLLNAHELPLFFVLGVNPEPIGKFLQRKYGLEDQDSYESMSILEKFLDGSVILPAQREIGKFIEHRLSQFDIQTEKFYPTVLKLQTRDGLLPNLPPGIGALPLFSNLRLITKTLEALTYSKPSKNIYSHWVWELMQVSTPRLAARAVRLANELEECADLAMGDLASQIKDHSGHWASIYSKSSSNLFDFYCHLFKERLKTLAHRRLRTEPGGGAGLGSLLVEVVSDSISVYSLAHLCCVDSGNLQTSNFQANGSDLRYSTMVPPSSEAFLQLKLMLLPSGKSQ